MEKIALGLLFMNYTRQIFLSESNSIDWKSFSCEGDMQSGVGLYKDIDIVVKHAVSRKCEIRRFTHNQNQRNILEIVYDILLI